MENPERPNTVDLLEIGPQIEWDGEIGANETLAFNQVSTTWAKHTRTLSIAGSLLALCIGVLFGHWFWPSTPVPVGSLSGGDSDVSGGPPASVETTENRGMQIATIIVDVHGDVRHPGVYHLAFGSRVSDAIRAAGGYLNPEDANNVNAAAPVNDGDEIVILSSQSVEVSSSQPVPTKAQVEVSAVTSRAASIDLNTATVTTLETLPEIGVTRAQAIVAYRKEHGAFGAISELLNVHGIGPVIYSKIAPLVIVVGGAPH